MSLHGDHEGGAAKRRRDRRLRMHWRHEQLTLQMALAAALHHSRDVGPVTYNALRSQKTARAEATNTAPRSQTTSVAGDTEFFSLYEEELGDTRPDRMYEVRPQEMGPAAHRGTDCRQHVLFAAVAGCSCAADGKPAGGRMSASRCLHSRAGYRSAQDLVYTLSSSQAPCALR